MLRKAAIARSPAGAPLDCPARLAAARNIKSVDRRLKLGACSELFFRPGYTILSDLMHG